MNATVEGDIITEKPGISPALSDSKAQDFSSDPCSTAFLM